MRRQRRRRNQIHVLLLALVLSPTFASAQLRSQVVVSGLTRPLEFVQDPSNPAVQYIVQQEGRIRVLSHGALQTTDFLNLTGDITTGGEQGLLGLAFPPNYGATGRFYIFFTNLAGDLVVSRFMRSGNPLVADCRLASRPSLVDRPAVDLPSNQRQSQRRAPGVRAGWLSVCRRRRRRRRGRYAEQRPESRQPARKASAHRCERRQRRCRRSGE